MNLENIKGTADQVENAVTTAVEQDAAAVKDTVVKGWEAIQDANDHAKNWVTRAKDAVEGELNAAALHFAKFWLNVANYFAAHAHINTFHFTADGQAFFNATDAESHANDAAKVSNGDKSITTITRDHLTAVCGDCASAAATVSDTATGAPATDAANSNAQPSTETKTADAGNAADTANAGSPAGNADAGTSQFAAGAANAAAADNAAADNANTDNAQAADTNNTNNGSDAQASGTGRKSAASKS